MLISEAYAQAADVAATMPAAPNPLWNFGMLVVMIVLFYVLLIMPQQKRFKEHSKMLSALEKGDAIVTGGGLLGTVTKVLSDDEVEVDLGNKMVVIVRRSTISGKLDKAPVYLKETKKAEAKAPAKKAAAKKAPAKKTATATAKTATKKAPAKKTAAKKAPAKKQQKRRVT